MVVPCSACPGSVFARSAELDVGALTVVLSVLKSANRVFTSSSLEGKHARRAWATWTCKLKGGSTSSDCVTVSHGVMRAMSATCTYFRLMIRAASIRNNWGAALMATRSIPVGILRRRESAFARHNRAMKSPAKRERTPATPRSLDSGRSLAFLGVIVAAAHHQRDEGRLQLRVRQPGRIDVAGQVRDAGDGEAPSPGGGLRVGRTHHQASGQARAT